MSTKLHLFYTKLREVNTALPIEHQLKEHELTADYDVGVGVFTLIFPEVQLTTEQGTVGDLINLATMACRDKLHSMIDKCTDYGYSAVGEYERRYAQRYSALFFKAIRLLDKDNIVIIRWS